MAATLDPADCAMLLIDHQVGTIGFIQTRDGDQTRAFAIALAKAAKVLDMPTVLTSSQEENRQGEILPEFADILPAAYEGRIRRDGVVNAWDEPSFRAAVEATGKRTLIMAGVTTDVCLVYPAVSAAAEGYAVHAVLDAAGSPFEASEWAARHRMIQAGVVPTATNTVIAELAGSWSSETGAPLVELLYGEVMTG